MAAIDRHYRSLRTGQIVQVTGYRKATLAGRYTTVYQLVWPDGVRTEVQAETFHRLFERVDSPPASESGESLLELAFLAVIIVACVVTLLIFAGPELLLGILGR